MYWKVKTNAVKSLYLQMAKNTKVLLLPGNGDMPEESESRLLPWFCICLPKLNKTTKKWSLNSGGLYKLVDEKVVL